jgi:spore germination protein YaaH
MRRLLLLLAGMLCCGAACAAPTALFYMTDSPESISSFLAHAAKIGILVPAWYNVDENGLVTGTPNATVLATAKAQGVPVMPILALFNKKKFHELALSSEAQARMNNALVHEAKEHGYVGIQIDFENVDYLDSANLNNVVAVTAEALHKAGLKITIATVPNAPGHPGSGGFSKWIFTDWRGAYDLAELAKSVDLICLMTYDQNTRWTMPGPVAGWQWTVENLDYALKVVPKDKLSLGIPLYGYHWYTNAPTEDKDGKEHPNVTGEYIKAANALRLATDYNGKLQWDADDHAAFFYFYRDQLREWIFYTDQRTFKDRYDLVKERGLEGFCSWALGEEDPAIWDLLPDVHPNSHPAAH